MSRPDLEEVAVKLLFFLPASILMFLVTACAFNEASRKQAAYHYQMGVSYLGDNDPTRALIELTEAEKLNPDDPLLLNSMGLAYFYKKRYD